jgi:hypothetical protein
MDELKITDEQLKAEFEEVYGRWTADNAPPGDDTALKALAWQWFMLGHRATAFLTARAFNQLGRAAIQLATDLHQRF